MSDLEKPYAKLDKLIEFLLYLTVAVVPLVYYNNPIATEYFFSKAFFFDFLVYGAWVFFFARAALRKQLTIHWGYTFLPLALFCMVALQSLIGAENVWKGWETIVRVGACIPFVFLMYQMTNNRDGVNRYLFVVALTNIAVTGYGFLQYYEVFPLPRDQYGTADPSTTIGLTNFVMEYLTPFMFVIPLMIFAAQRRSTRFLFVLATLFQYYYFAISDNRAAMVGMAAALPVGALLFYLQYRRGTFRFQRQTTAIAAAALILLAVGFGMSPQGSKFISRAQSIMNFKGQDDAITFRLETWKQSASIIKDYPLRGVGLSNLEVMFPLYQSPYLEWMTLKKNTRVVRAHNEYVQVLADLGLIGALVFFFFLYRLFRLSALAYQRALQWEDLLLVTGLIMGVVGYLIVAIFAFPFNVPSSALSIFVVVGLLEVMARRVLGNDDRSYSLQPAAASAVSWSALAVTAVFWIFSTTWMWNVLRAEVYFKESRVMKDLNQWEVARNLLDEAIRYYPQNEAYYYDRSIFSIRDGDPRAALKYLTKTAELVPNYAMGHKQIGLLAAQLGDYKRAATEIAFAYKIYKSQHADYVPLLANAYIGAGQTDDALALVEKTKDLEVAEVQLAAGQVLIHAKRPQEAVTRLQKAVELRPAYQEAYTFLGMAFVETGEPAKALAAFETAGNTATGTTSITKHQKSAVAMGKAKALLALNRTDEAVAVVKAAIASDPGTTRMISDDKILATSPAIRPLLTP